MRPHDDRGAASPSAGRRTPNATNRAQSSATWNIWMFALTSGVAVVAAADGLAIITGVAHLDPHTLQAVPGNSPILLGIGVILAVAFPAGSAAFAIRCAVPTAGVDVVIAGAGLLGWTVIVVEATDRFGWLQVLSVVTGACLSIIAAVHTWSSAPATVARGRL